MTRPATKTVADITPAEMERYRTAYRRRAAKRERERLARQLAAMDEAVRLAGVLRRDFGATRVVLHGSLARQTFGFRSDIDLAVWGLCESGYLDTLVALMETASFDVDLALYETVPQALRDAIDRDGVAL